MRKTLDSYLDEQLGRGRGYLTKAEAMKTLSLSATAFAAACGTFCRQRRLASPKHGFYLILRPEDRAAGGPDPARWIDPLMDHLGLDYRISLLRAAAFHGASHQAAQVFQVIVPKQLRTIAIDRQRIQFVYQASQAFAAVNKAPWLDQLKTDAGFAKVAGVELLLLDVVLYFRLAAVLYGAAQIVHDLGAMADPSRPRRHLLRELHRGARLSPEHFTHSSGGQPASARPEGEVIQAARPVRSRRGKPRASQGARCARLEAESERTAGD
jgi:hypothetical protein